MSEEHDWTNGHLFNDNDKALLKAIKCLHEKGMMQEAMCLASWYGDTYIREAIPPEVWVEIGGTLTLEGIKRLKRREDEKDKGIDR